MSDIIDWEALEEELADRSASTARLNDQ